MITYFMDSIIMADCVFHKKQDASFLNINASFCEVGAEGNITPPKPGTASAT